MKKFFSFFPAIVMCFLLFAGTVYGQERPEIASPIFSDDFGSSFSVKSKTNYFQTTSLIGNEFLNGGNRLAAVQNADGGWGWPLTGTSAPNTIGPIAMGLAQAYQQTGSASQLTALNKVGTFLLAKLYNFSPSDGYIAAQLDKLLGVTTYTNHVKTNYYDKLESGTYNRNNAGTLYSTATYTQLIRTARSGSNANMAAWDLGMGLVGAAMCNAVTTDWITAVKAEIDELDSSNYYDVLGLAGALYGLAYVNEDFDPTSGSHAAASNLNDLANILASYQINGGGFAWNSYYVIANDNNETVQETSYSILALNEFDRNTFLSSINGAADYLSSVQLGTGGFENYSGSGENNEITGEALWAMSNSYPAPVYNITKDVYHSTIQSAISFASSGNTLTLAAGTYNVSTTLSVNKSITIIGENQNTVIIDGTTATAANNLIDITAPNVTIQNLTVEGNVPQYTVWPPSRPYYGINISSAVPNNIVLQNVTVKSFGKSGFNLNGASNVAFENCTALDNGGAGIFMGDVNNISLENITTSNNQWGGVAVGTWGRYYTGGVSGVVFSGTNTFGENSDVMGGLYIEEGNYNDKANPIAISFSSNPLDNANVTYLSTDFGYTLNGPQDDGDPNTSDGYRRIRFYDTEENVSIAANTPYNADHLSSPGHLLDNGRYIINLSGENFEVPDGLDIQTALDVAQPGDEINVSSGNFPSITINKPITLNGNGAIVNHGSPAMTVASTGVTILNFTFVFDSPDFAIDVLNGAYDVNISSCNFLNTNGINVGNGVRNQGTGTVDARNNYWNSLTGPTIASNVGGTGAIADNASTGVLLYSPWAVPVNLISPANNSTGISVNPTFNWSLVADAVSYDLEISVDDTTWTTILDDGNVTSFTVDVFDKLNSNTTYSWRVKINGGNLDAVYSDVWKFTTSIGQVVISTYYPFGSSASLAWYLLPFGTNVKYDLFYSENSDMSNYSIIPNLTTTYYTLANLRSGMTYYVVVRAKNIDGSVIFTYSDQVSFATEGLPQPVLTYPIAGVVTYSNPPYLYWYGGTYDANTEYEIKYWKTSLSEPSPNDFELDPYVAQNADSGYFETNSSNMYAILAATLTPGTEYSWKVRIKKGISSPFSFSDWSATETFIMNGTIPNAAPNVYLSWPIAGNTSYLNPPTLYWYTGTYTTGLYFEMQLSTDGFTTVLDTISDIPNLYYTIPTALNANTYQWRVRSKIGIGGIYGNWSVIESFVIPNSFSTVSAPYPTAPIGLTVPTLNPTLYWYALTPPALKYRVRISPYSSTDVDGKLNHASAVQSNWVTSNSSDLNSLTFTPSLTVQAGVTYYWQVQASLIASPYTESNWSYVTSFTTAAGSLAIVPMVGSPSHGQPINSTSAVLSWILPQQNETHLKFDVEYSKNAEFQNSVVIKDVNEKIINVEGLEPEATYYWRVLSKNSNGYVSNYSEAGTFKTEVGITDVENEILPAEFSLDQNYPNPFNPATTITFSLPQNSFVTLKIYDLLGREVKTLVNKNMNAGKIAFDWKGDDNFGNKVASGTYIYRITAGNFVSSKKMMLLK